MLPIETQEAIIAESFFDELQKCAGVFGDMKAAFDVVNKSRLSKKFKEKAIRYSSKSERYGKESKDILKNTEAGKELSGKGTTKALIGAGALGLGAAGYGYYQYKRDLNDQASGNFTQAS